MIEELEPEGRVVSRVLPRPLRLELSYRPPRLPGPVRCESIVSRPALSEVSGDWLYYMVIPETPYAARTYSLMIGTRPLSYAPVFVFGDGTVVGTYAADEMGMLTITFPSERPRYSTYSVSPVPLHAPIKGPLHDRFEFSVWLVRCRVTNESDIHFRLVGRSFGEPLAREFWEKQPWTLVGLTSRFGVHEFADLVPVFSDAPVIVEYGVSAFCRSYLGMTSWECIRDRPYTWWRFEVECYNEKFRGAASARLNVDRHLRLTLTARDVRAEVIRPEGAET